MKRETTIDGVQYVLKDSISKFEPIDESTEPLRIIMNMDRGLCIVGNVNLDTDGPLLKIKNARCIIKWGTSKHLAELADQGPLENTVFGHEYPHTIPHSSIALILDCNMGNWGNE
jgi:hypothetical protein